MNLNTFYQSCVYIRIGLIVLTMSINFVSGMGVFDFNMNTGFGSGTSDEVFEDITDVNFTGDDTHEADTGMQGLWLIMLTGAGAGGVVLAFITKSPVILGVFVFSAVFWASYINAAAVLGFGGYIPAGFLAIGTTVMGFFWAGAIAGMLSGSG